LLEGKVHHVLQRIFDPQLSVISPASSMAAVGNPYENAKAESFFKTLKVEEVYLKDYRGFEEAEENIGQFIEEVYNQKRLHSSLGYLPPVEFEAQHTLKARS
jgi:transposase InsO family protein